MARLFKRLDESGGRSIAGRHFMRYSTVNHERSPAIKNRRAKYYHIWLTPSRRLLITARRFKTSKTNRATSFRQLVIPVYGLGVKEIAIRQVRLKRRPRHLITLLKRPALAPTVFMMLGLAGLGFFGWQSLHKNRLEAVRSFSVAPAKVEATAKAKEPAKPKTLPRSEPTRLSIPAIGIDSGVMQLGKNPDGSLETPPVLEYITGWYRESPTPGELGPSVIVGHVDSYKGVSVFWRLRELKAGDEIDVTRADGKVAKFRVEALSQFDQNNFPTKEVYGNIDHAGLRLITCGGAFDSATGQYLQNTVVFASLI